MVDVLEDWKRHYFRFLNNDLIRKIRKNTNKAFPIRLSDEEIKDLSLAKRRNNNAEVLTNRLENRSESVVEMIIETPSEYY